MKRLIVFILGLCFVNQINAQVFTSFPEKIEPDSVHAPFYHGIASGDQLIDGVIIWTRITPENEEVNSNITVFWELAESDDFNTLVGSGQFITDSTRDWTVKVDVSGLSSGTTYYYRFRNEQGNFSSTGRTKTLPDGNVETLKFGVTSCANIFQGYFNAYRFMAERDDLDAVIYLGDFIYNNDGSTSPIRIPTPSPSVIDDENSIEDWYDRHSYYHYDVDFRQLLAAYPSIIIWDNHDVDKTFYEPAVRAWLDWVPVRENEMDKHIIYRQFNYGDLVSLNMVDVNAFRAVDTFANGEYSFLGNEQFVWLTDKLSTSTARWNIIGQQKNYAVWSVGAELGALLDLTNNEIGKKNWSSRTESRNQLNNFLKVNDIENVMVLSGDAHVAVVADLDPDFTDNTDYDGNTGEGAIGVEFLPSGITSANLNEKGFPSWIEDLVVALSLDLNPHQVYVDLVNHGYGILDINKDSIVASICYNNIRQVNDNQWCFKFIMYNGTNHWKRDGQSYEGDTLMTAIFDNFIDDISIDDLFPNPTEGSTTLVINSDRISRALIEIFEVSGKSILKRNTIQRLIVKGENQINIQTNDLSNGQYLVGIEIEGQTTFKQLVVAK